jgi:hypothetical protein
MADVHAFGFANLDSVKAWRLSAHRVHTRRRDLNVFAIADQPAKKSFRDGTATNIASANKEDAFHGWRRARERKGKVGLNVNAVNQTSDWVLIFFSPNFAGDKKQVCGG